MQTTSGQGRGWSVRAILERAAPLLLSVGLVLLCEMLVTLEWSSPLCTREYQSWNGPISGAYGAPFPYLRWSMASSLEYYVMVRVYLINIGLLSLVFYPLVSWLVGRVKRPSLLARLGDVGAGLCGLVIAWRLFLVALGLWIPSASIAFLGEERYTEFRPVGIATFPDNECTESSWLEHDDESLEKLSRSSGRGST